MGATYDNCKPEFIGQRNLAYGENIRRRSVFRSDRDIGAL